MKLGLGTGLAKGRPSGDDPRNFTTLAIFGDSITAQNTAINSPGIRFASIGYAAYGNFLLNHGFDFVKKTSTAHGDGVDWDFGYGGYSAEELLNGKSGVYPMNDLAASDPSHVFVFCGSNPDATTAESIIAIWDTLRAAGRRVFAAEVLPRAESFGSTVRDAIYAVNVTIKAAAAARGIPFLEWASTFAVSPGGYANPAYVMADGVHPNILGASVLGDVWADWIGRWAVAPFEVPAAASASWVTGNPYMSGDVSGGATGWTFPAACSAKSKITDPDGTVWQRITNTQAGYAGAIYRQTAGTGTWSVGDTVRGVCRVRGVASGWDIKNIDIRVVQIGGSATESYAMYSATSDITATGIVSPMTGLIVGPPHVVQTGVTALYTYVRCYGSGTFDFTHCGCVKI